MVNFNFGPLVARHRSYYLAGKTRPLGWREAQLAALRAMIFERRDDFYHALWQDLHRNRVDADLVDVKYVVDEVDYALKHLRSWTQPERMSVPSALRPGHVTVRFDPLGVGLIIGAWNYPMTLTLSPLVAAIAGGNAAVIKPSELAEATADVLARLVPKYLDPGAFSVVLGGVPETSALLEQEWDHIFFTGAPSVGKIVMSAAAQHLTPVVLELGGKNPTIVHSSADLRVAARRIAHGKWLNAGQSGTAPDYVLALTDIKEEFLGHLRDVVVEFYGQNPQQSQDYGRIINHHHFDRLTGLLNSGEVYYGGEHDRDDRYIAPTILVNVPLDAPVMQEEIFGPILPVLEADSIQKAIDFVNARPSPLGLYVFAGDLDVAEDILDATRSGDAAVNDCGIQPLVPELPFGGVGTSGMGKYHGTWGFHTYTNARGVLSHSTRVDSGVRYPPHRRHEQLPELYSHKSA